MSYLKPIFVSYGMGVDSTAVLVGLKQRGIRPDAITFADVGDEKVETRDYYGIISEWLAKTGFPPVTVVRYRPQRFKYEPGYATLGENCMTNATLPSLAFGRKSCSLKWKVAPQERHDAEHPLAIEAWAKGQKVTRMIGYDASPADNKRATYAGQKAEHPLYHFAYPLQDWGWTRPQCIAEIADAGLEIPQKSACIFCPATKPDELRNFRKEYLRKIVLMEARAHDNLQGNWTEARVDQYNADRLEAWVQSGEDPDSKPKPIVHGKGTQGLWRTATKKRSGRMTDFIASEGLLPAEEIEKLQDSVHCEPYTDADVFEIDNPGSHNWLGACNALGACGGGFTT